MSTSSEYAFVSGVTISSLKVAIGFSILEFRITNRNEQKGNETTNHQPVAALTN